MKLNKKILQRGMQVLILLQSIVGFLIPTYGEDSDDEINMLKQTHIINPNILRAVDTFYLISTLKKIIPLDIVMHSENIASIASLSLDLLTEEDFIVMDTIFDPDNKNKTKKPLNSTDVFEIMLFLLMQNVIEIAQMTEDLLTKFRELFRRKFVFEAYPAKVIHVMLNKSVFRVSLPEYLYLGFYVYTRDKSFESDFEKKVKCIIKSVGDRKNIPF